MINQKFCLLIGGLGTRLQKAVSNTPKPMALINGKPFLWYKLNQLKKVGFNRFVFCAGYMVDKIIDYFGNGQKLGIEIEYSIEKSPLGTAGAIKHAEELLGDNFFVGNGDTYLEFDPNPMISFIEKLHAKYCILLTSPHEKGQEGCVTLDSHGRILNFNEKPNEAVNSRWINAGVYYLDKHILSMIPINKKTSLENSVFPEIIESDALIYGFNYQGYFIDIGLPHNYYRFIDDVNAGRVI